MLDFFIFTKSVVFVSLTFNVRVDCNEVSNLFNIYIDVKRSDGSLFLLA